MNPLDFVSFALLILLAYKERQWEQRERAWALERAALINRIQRPDVYTPPAVEWQPEAESATAELTNEADDEIDRVGTVVGGRSDGEN